MELIIITGYSGAGKSIAERVFEDIGYFCVDNLPAALIKDFVRLASSNKNIDKVAVVVDSRAGAFCNDIDDEFENVEEYKVSIKENVLGNKVCVMFINIDLTNFTYNGIKITLRYSYSSIFNSSWTISNLDINLIYRK